ncbi:MAG: glycerate kinase [Bacteroidales bacterium]|nr:glycerate kinase [Bacteroidales bacterium]
MKKILLAFDKFKYTLTAEQVTAAVRKGITSVRNDLLIHRIPVADGGEGTADILSHFFKCKKISTEVNNPLFRKISVQYYYSSDNQTAVIDISEASGLFLLKEEERNPLLTSTYGTGEMILDAVKKGAKKIILGLGGSATTDAGTGAAKALGYKFLTKSGEVINPLGKNLVNISNIDDTEVIFPFDKIKIIALYDVDNILYGKAGAAFTYSEQKGANQDELKILDVGLKNIAKIIKRKYGKDVSKLIGGGAAGGFGAGAFAFLRAELQSGSDTLLRLADFESKIKDADLIITGEGKFDIQSFQGKITGKIIEKAQEYNIPVIVICGKNNLSPEETKQKNIKSIHALFEGNVNIEEAKKISFQLIVKTAKDIAEKL